jgi:hypothetical protein
VKAGLEMKRGREGENGLMFIMAWTSRKGPATLIGCSFRPCININTKQEKKHCASQSAWSISCLFSLVDILQQREPQTTMACWRPPLVAVPTMYIVTERYKYSVHLHSFNENERLSRPDIFGAVHTK